MNPEIEDILQATAEVHGVPVAYITQDSQLDEVTKVRHVAQYLCRKYTTSSLRTIGREIGGRSHGMVTVAHKKIEDECEVYDDTRSLVEDIRFDLQGKGFTLWEVKRHQDNDWHNSDDIYRR
jgi:chromosomal replication initiation ATPase DnaA